MQEPADQISEQEYRRLRELIEAECGVLLPPAKRLMLETRIRRRARVLNLESLSAYCSYLGTVDGKAREWPHFIDAITTHKTDFFREPLHFEYLIEQTLPVLLEESGVGFRRPLLVWSAACSTGEEPYTLAMVLREYALSFQPRHFYFQIAGTDIAVNVLDTARKAVYPETSISPIPEPLRRKYLRRGKDPQRGLVRLSPEIRGHVTFRQLNLLHSAYGFDAPLDIVFCRNVMIYFDQATQERVLTRITANLKTGGYLFMGHSESLNNMDLPLKRMSPTVYRRVDG